MPLTRVTITGADDGTDPADLLALSQEFPFVEHGILLAASRVGTSRYPSFRWLLGLYEVAARCSGGFDLSCHLCGKWARDFASGWWTLPWRYEWLPSVFGRAQINFTAAPETDYVPLAAAMASWGRQEFTTGPGAFILQHNANNGRFFDYARHADVPVLPLFDASGGRGEKPAGWPRADYTDPNFDPDAGGTAPPIPHGYAGGLGPDNLADELPRIAAAAGDAPFWIDLESGARTDNRFDLEKVRRVLEIAAPFASPVAAA